MQVKSVTTFSIDKRHPDISYKNSYIEYNSNGYVIEATEWSAGGDIESKILTNYNANNKVIEEINYISEDEITEHSFFTRNDDDSVKTIEILFADESKTIKEFEHNSEERSRTITIFNEDGEFEGNEFYKLDNAGNVLEKVILNFNKKLEEKLVFVYNENGQILQEDQVDERNIILSSRRFTYDDMENLIEIITINDKNNIIEKVVTSYDDKKRIVEQIIKGSYLVKISYDDENHCKTEERFTSGSQLNYIMTTFFNEKGMITEEQTYSNIIKYEYDYFDDIQQK